MTWQLPPLRPGREPSEPLRARRADLARMRPDRSLLPLPVEERTIGGIACLVVTPPQVSCELLYLHGGGYRMGEPASWTPLAARLASALDARVTLPDYRLAPEHPFPAALHDVAAVYGSLREDTAGRVLAAGDSAGGGLAASLAAACAASGVALPDALVLLSLWLDLTLRGDTHSSRADSDLLFPPASSTEAADLYLQGHDATDPLASPAFADVAGFPPTFLAAGTEETLLSDALDFAARLAVARVGTTLLIGAGMQHAWPMVFPDIPASATAVEAIRSFGAGLASVQPVEPWR